MPWRTSTGARCLVMVGDSVTTDHISPAGAIKLDSPAGHYLQEHGVERKDFNSYGSRRGNHEVMVRGTFANVRLRNLLVPGSEGTWTVHLPDGEETTIFDAAVRYKADGVPTIVLAGKEYGSGSSRDWAAKGPNLLGVRAVLAESYERIHRSNLIGMGIVPLQYPDGESAESLGLTGRERFAVEGLENGEASEAQVKATSDGGGNRGLHGPRATGHSPRAGLPAPRRDPACTHCAESPQIFATLSPDPLGPGVRPLGLGHVMSRNRRRFIVALAAAVLAGIGLVGNAVAAPSCAYDGASSTVNATLGAGDSATLAVDASGQITFGAPAAPCGVATNTNTDKIVVSGPAGSTEHLVIDQFGGRARAGRRCRGQRDLRDRGRGRPRRCLRRGRRERESRPGATRGRDARASGSTRTATSTSPSRRFRPRSSSSPPVEESHVLTARGGFGSGHLFPGPVTLRGGQPGRLADRQRLRRPAVRRQRGGPPPRLGRRRRDQRRQRKRQATRGGRKRLPVRRHRCRRLLGQLRRRHARCPRRCGGRTAERRSRGGQRGLRPRSGPVPARRREPLPPGSPAAASSGSRSGHRL